MTRDQISGRILQSGVVAIFRTDNSEPLIEASRALMDGGVSNIEVTLTTPDALKIISELRRVFGDKVLPGVGSVINVEMAERAIDAGAEYVITPVLRADVIAVCNRLNKPIFAGCYTPTEAQTAFEWGADFVKIFPAEGLGPNYIRAILGPLPHLKIVPTGGVDVTTAGAFIKAGCVAIAAGSTLIGTDVLKNKDWPKLTNMAEQFVTTVAAARKSLG